MWPQFAEARKLEAKCLARSLSDNFDVKNAPNTGLYVSTEKNL